MKLTLRDYDMVVHVSSIQKVIRLDDGFTTIAVDLIDDAGCKLTLFVETECGRELIKKLKEEIL